MTSILVKDPHKLSLIAETADIVTKEPLSFGAMTPFVGSHAFNSLKFWATIKSIGKKGIGELIYQRHKLMLDLYRYLKKDNDFVLLNEIGINSLCFYFFPLKYRQDINETEIEIFNEINTKIFRKIFEHGTSYIHSFHIIDEGNKISKTNKYSIKCLRIMPGNPNTNIDTLIDIVKSIKYQGHKIIKNNHESQKDQRN